MRFEIRRIPDGSLHARILDRIWFLLSLVFGPDMFTVTITCRLCGKTVSDTNRNEHVRFFHPEVLP